MCCYIHIVRFHPVTFDHEGSEQASLIRAFAKQSLARNSMSFAEFIASLRSRSANLLFFSAGWVPDDREGELKTVSELEVIGLLVRDSTLFVTWTC